MGATSSVGSGFDRSSPEVREALVIVQAVVAPVSRNEVHQLALTFLGRDPEEVATEVTAIGHQLVETMTRLNPKMPSSTVHGLIIAFFDLVRGRLEQLQNQTAGRA